SQVDNTDSPLTLGNDGRMDEAMKEVKKLIDRFEKRTGNFREKNENGELEKDEMDTVELLAKMVDVYKVHTTDEDGDEDLMKSLRSVRKAVKEKRGPIAHFAKIFVHMHTHFLEKRGSGIVPSVSSNLDESSSTSTSSPSSISVPSSSSSNIPDKTRRRTMTPQETVVTGRRRQSAQYDKPIFSPLLSPLPETPKRNKRRESTVVDEEKENEAMIGAKSEDTVEEGKKKKKGKRSELEMLLDVDMKLEMSVVRSSARRRTRSMSINDKKREEAVDTVAEDTVGSIDGGKKEGSARPDNAEESEAEFCEVTSSSTPGRAKTGKAKTTLDDYYRPTNREANKRAADEGSLPSTSSRLKENNQKETMDGPRLKKARAAMDRNPMVAEPAHHGRGGADSWECGGLSCKIKLTTSSAIYHHMMNEHLLDGPVVAKCLDCAQIGSFPDLIVHRKSGDESTCGGEHAKLAYWCVEEEKKQFRDMNEEEKEKEEDKEELKEISDLLRKCVIIGCNREGEIFDTFEQLKNHYEKVHSCYLLYECPNPGCLRTFTNPTVFIRHRLPYCKWATPIVKSRLLRKEEEEKEEKEE
ncbi:hypothetical protein PENTCL1PPCAC_11903, partial [Pristionchus entomophagus]